MKPTMTVSEDLIQRVWEKGVIADLNPKIWRKDQFGAWISRIRHGDRNSDYGWEIDTFKSSGKFPSNFHPVQWKNYIGKIVGKINSFITADGYSNAERKIKL